MRIHLNIGYQAATSAIIVKCHTLHQRRAYTVKEIDELLRADLVVSMLHTYLKRKPLALKNNQA